MNNIKAIAAQLQQEDLDALLITEPINRRYATGFRSTAGTLLILPDTAYFIIDSRYIELAKATVTDAQVIQIQPRQPYTALLSELLEKHGVHRLGFEDEAMSYSQFSTYQSKLEAELIPAQHILSRLRESKSLEEMELIRTAESIGNRAFADILNIIKPEMTETEVAAELVYRMLKYGGENISFDPIVVSGTHSSRPHGQPEDRPLERGFLTMDFGCIYQGYCSDMTRTIAIGEPTDEMRQVYATVLEAQLAGIACARAGVPGREVDAAGRQVIAGAGFGEYFGHGFGHSLGMEVHEAPNCAPSEERALPVGAVVSAEPGIYLPGRFGVRIEDILYITEEGSVNLTQSPKELIVL